MSNPYTKYQEDIVYTASKETLTLMLYDGALKYSNQAIAAIEAKDYVKANELIIRTQDIIREFQITLNRDIEISKNFDSLYEYIYGLLLQGNIKKDITLLSEARDLIREFRDTWKEAMKLARHQATKA